MKSVRFEMRLDQATANRIDLWSNKQLGSLSRSEAVRQLVDTGLAASHPNEFYPNNTEKLMIILCCEILKKLDTRSEIDPELIKHAMTEGHFWAIGWQMQDIISNKTIAPKSVTQVNDILEMWNRIEDAKEELSTEEQTELEKGDSLSEFFGFDGHNETEHFSIAHFMIKKMGRYGRFKNHNMDLDSHMPMVRNYLTMVEKYKTIRPALAGRNMNLAELKIILSRDN